VHLTVTTLARSLVVFKSGVLQQATCHFILCELGGLQSRAGSFGEHKNLLPLLGIKPQFLGRPARSLVTIPSTLSWLPITLQ
jgi:hypothetical protein